MIKFDKETNTIHLFNKNISYYIYINEFKRLQTPYFGKRLDIDNFNSLVKTNSYWRVNYYDVNKKEELPLGDFKPEQHALEISSNGYSNKKGAPILFKDKYGLEMVDFEVVKFKIFKGIRVFDKLPCADRKLDSDETIMNKEHAQSVEITLKNVASNVYVKEYLTIYDDKDIIVKNFTIINKERKPLKLTRAYSMQLDLTNFNHRMHHFNGRWGYERFEVVDDIKDGEKIIRSNNGRSSHEENPFIFLTEKNATLSSGEVIGFNLIYSSNFIFRIFNDNYNATHILYGINDEDFEWNLKPGEEFVTPQAVIAYSSEGINKMSIAMHSFIKENLITYRHDKEYKPVIFNSWEGCYFTFTTDTLLSYIDDAKKIGTELFVLDDGWFGARDNDKAGLGDWYVNLKKVDLKKVIDHCHELGMKFGIWYEPEMANYDSDLYRAHPDWILQGDRDQILLHRHQFHLDMSNPEVVDNIYKQMIDVLDKYEIDYVKWDYNRVIFEHLSKYLDKEHQGEVYHRNVLGYYDLIERIIKRYPDMMIEGCCSGGGRFDMGTLFYTPQIWTSDEQNPSVRMFIQYNTSLGYPLQTMGSHVNRSNAATYASKADLALFGTYGYELNPNNLTQEEMETLAQKAKIYKDYHLNVIDQGTCYHLASPQENDYMAMQAVSKDKKYSLVLFMNSYKIVDRFNFLKLDGLNPNAKYHVDFDGEIYSGKYLMTIGLNLAKIYCNEQFTTKLITITQVE
jgi:alpha-galactosidase